MPTPISMSRIPRTRSRLQRNFALIPLIAWLGGTANAQMCHPLSGTWVLSARSSEGVRSLSFNPYYRVKTAALRMRTSGGRIYETWTFRGRNLNEHWTYWFKPNGHSYRTQSASKLYSVPTAVVARWQNCTLIVSATSMLFGEAITTVNTYVFSAAGKSLTVLQTIDSPIMHTVRRLVFRREQRTRSTSRGPVNRSQVTK